MKITKTALLLCIFFALAFSLRLAGAYFIDIGSDEMIYTLIPLNIISAGRLSTVEQAPLYFYLVDIGYKISRGMSLISGRLPSIFFGSLAVILVYLFAQELFAERKSALLSAFLFAISGYTLRYNQEMDTTAFFLSLLSMYFFFLFLRMEKNQKYFYLSALFLALAVLVKPIVLLFLPAYAIVFFVKWRGEKRHKERKKIENELDYQRDREHPIDSGLVFGNTLLPLLLKAFFLCLLVVSPVLIYNALLYQEKGFTDYYFSVFAGIGNTNNVYQGQEAEPWVFGNFVNTSVLTFNRLFHYDVLLLLLGIIGMFFSLRKNRSAVLFFALTLLFLLFYVGGKMSGSNHFLWMPIVLSLFSGFGMASLLEKVNVSQIITRLWGKMNFNTFKLIICIFLLLALINSVAVLKEIHSLRENSFAIALQKYSAEHISKEAIVVLDPRIYRGVFAWAFHDHHYLEGTYFPELANKRDSFPGKKEDLPIYYIECGPGTNCGWKPEDFQRIYGFGQELSDFFHKQTTKIAEVKAIDTFMVYQGTFSVSPSIYDSIDRTHLHWYTPVGWKYPELAVDAYVPKTFLNKTLNGFGLLILYADVLLVLLSPFLVVYLLWKRSC